jgi:hypothetical protein
VQKKWRYTVERFRPALYFENDVKESSPALPFVMGLGYTAYWHPAIFDEDNFFSQREEFLAPGTCSLMVLACERRRSP